MKRKEIVSSLIKEGFTEKTLASMSDKELKLMAERVLNEQGAGFVTGSDGAISVTNVAKTDVATQNALKQYKKPFATYEGEMSEEDMGGDSKEYFIKKIKYKIEHETDENKIENLKELLRRIGEKVEEPQMDTVGLNEWVDHLVGKNVHPFTSKTEILGLIKSKINEQEAEVAEPEVETLPDFLTYDAIKGAQPAPAEPSTKPTTRPGKPDQKPKKDNPYQPGPGINPRPKAEKK